MLTNEKKCCLKICSSYAAKSSNLCLVHKRWYARQHYAKNKDAIRKKHKQWQLDNPEKHAETMKKARKKWRQNNPEKARRDFSRWIEQLKLATPKWVDAEQIKSFYKNRPPGMHVDHIEPLKGKDRCGLHVLHNLQYLSPSANGRKTNRG